jgi:ribosomal protein L18E
MGEVQALSVLGGATNAGIYTARVGIPDQNYRLVGSSCDYEIKKADYDMSGVLWNGTSFVYDGSKRSVTLTGLPKGVSVVSYEGDVASNAGRYTATATLSWDSANYNAPILPSHSWEIIPAEYDLGGFRFVASTHTFDGNIHYPTLEGKMPVGIDGLPLEYSFSGGATHVSDGRVSVIISFKSASKNYNIPNDQYSSVSITPKGINVIWSGEQLYYNGERQSPTAMAKECSVKVSGAALTVGKYTATAESQNGDYSIINDKMDFEILKATNGWKVMPSASTCYEGREIKLIGESKFGSVKYSFYADPEGTEKISVPTIPGRYYARLTVEESINYEGLVSALIPFEIVKIVPISFIASLDGALPVAFGVISAEDITASVVNNDGSRDSVDSSLVSVIYQNGDSLRKQDKSVTLVYDKFTLTLPIVVDYATYDMSGVRWENIAPVYTGSPLFPELLGLPEGVSVLSYSDSEMINAGVYTITPRFSYDSDNYHAPSVPACRFTIEKKPLTPSKITSVYNGKYQLPVSDSLLYTVEMGEGFRDVGIYALTLKLTDSTNYVFALSGGDRVNGLFEITPAAVGVRVKDTTLHLFEKLKDAEYYITSGMVYAGDYVGLEFFIDDGKIYAASKNPNYVLNVSAGGLTRLPYPTFNDSIRMLGVLMLILLLIFGIIFLYKKRQRLATVIGILKCRIKHRHFTVADPIDEPRVTESPNSNEKTRQSAFYDDNISFSVDEGHADMLITDPQAKSLVKKDGDVVYTTGTERARITVGEISDAFSPGDTVDINALKEKGILSEEVNNLKVVGGGRIDKSLTVYANDFTLSAVKMIALCGGRAIKCVTLRSRPKEKE